MMPGEVYWVDYPPPTGRAQAFRRPALVLQDDTFARRSPVVFVVPITSKASGLQFPATVAVGKTARNGLQTDSYILVSKAGVADRGIVQGLLGTLEPAVLAAVYDALDRLTGRPGTSGGTSSQTTPAPRGPQPINSNPPGSV